MFEVKIPSKENQESESQKGKKREKSLNMRICICYTSDKKMKIVEIKGLRYFVQDKDDMISIAHELTEKGYNIKQIAQILGVTEKKVRKMMEDCW